MIINPINNENSTFTSIPPQASVENRNQDRVSNWHTQLTSVSDCLKDEETTWFGLWCCWIVNARTVHQFSLGDSFKETAIFWAILAIFLLLFVTGGSAILFGLSAFAFLAWRRANTRTAMRQNMSIPGTFCDDLMIHTICSCCAICQEAREAKVINLPAIDYCFGERLSMRQEAHELAILGSTNSSSTTILESADQGDCASHIVSISKTSKFILLLWSVLALFTVIMDVILNESANILVLMLIFVQPLTILYFLYWKQRRQHALLDYVIKTFAYGFWFATFQSAVLEMLLQLIFGIALAIIDPSIGSAEDLSEAEQRNILKSHILLLLLSLFVMAFVVAAGVEESMKHFVVRCCQFPTALTNPHTILVYLLAGALGFATAENIEYVFSQSGDASIGSITLLEGELLILLMRVLTPVHAICSVIQAAAMSKFVIARQEPNLLMILLPAVALHGTFDFVLFLIAALGFIYNLSDGIAEVISMIVAIFLTIAGTVYAYYSFNKVATDYREGWVAMPNTDDTEVVNSRL